MKCGKSCILAWFHYFGLVCREQHWPGQALYTRASALQQQSHHEEGDDSHVSSGSVNNRLTAVRGCEPAKLV